MQIVLSSANDNVVVDKCATDIWAAGVLAYELLVGGPPFETPTREETLQCIVEDDPFIPSHLSEEARIFLRQVKSCIITLVQHKPGCGHLH